MRPAYSEALRSILEQQVEAAPRSGWRGHPRRGRLWREIGVGLVVAAVVVSITTTVLTRSLVQGPADPGDVPSATTSVPSDEEYLGLVPWSDPRALAVPAYSIYVADRPHDLDRNEDTCGVDLVVPSVAVSSDGVATVALRGYGRRVARGAQCSLVRVDRTPLLVVLGRVAEVRSVIDPSTGTSSPLGLLPLPSVVRQARTAAAPGGVGGTLAAVPSGAVASISARQAVSVCATGRAACGTGAPDSMSLALVTNTNGGTPVTDRLAYVLVWRHETCVPTGGPPASSSSRAAAPTDFPCVFVVAVDARTGATLYDYDTGRQLG